MHTLLKWLWDGTLSLENGVVGVGVVGAPLHQHKLRRVEILKMFLK